MKQSQFSVYEINLEPFLSACLIQISNNDVGIIVVGNSGCCKIHNNNIKGSHTFGILVVDGSQTISQTKISGGNVGVAAIAFSANTVATLVNDNWDNNSAAELQQKIVTVPPSGTKFPNLRSI